jgi:fatty acid desaturase
MAGTNRRRAGPSRLRNKRRETQARETRAAQERASQRKQISLRAYQLRRALGWGLVGLGVLVGVSHWLSHIGLWGFASQGLMDLVAGYPMAALLGVAGAIVLGRLSK